MCSRFVGSAICPIDVRVSNRIRFPRFYSGTELNLNLAFECQPKLAISGDNYEFATHTVI